MGNTRTVTAEIFGNKRTTICDLAGINGESNGGRKQTNGKGKGKTNESDALVQYQDPLNTYVSIRGFCTLTNFPENKIRALVAREAVPFLKAGPKVLLQVRDVMECLSKMAMEHAEL